MRASYRGSTNACLATSSTRTKSNPQRRLVSAIATRLNLGVLALIASIILPLPDKLNAQSGQPLDYLELDRRWQANDDQRFKLGLAYDSLILAGHPAEAADVMNKIDGLVSDMNTITFQMWLLKRGYTPPLTKEQDDNIEMDQLRARWKAECAREQAERELKLMQRAPQSDMGIRKPIPICGVNG